MPSNEITVSIIIATYNAANFLPSCLKSINNQTFKSLEIIVIDGASTDNTLEILESYKGVKCIYKSESDTGIYNAFNKAIKLASGKWLLFLGADDLLLSDFSEFAMHLVNEDALYYGDFMVNGERFGNKTSSYNIAKMNYCHQAILYPSKIFKTFTFVERYCVFADYLLNIQCWGSTKITKQYLSIAIVSYNPTGFSSYTNDVVFKNDKPLFIKKYLGTWIYLRYMLRKIKSKKRGDTEFF